DPARQKFKRHNRVDRSLPDHCLRTILGHGPLVVDDVVQVRLELLAGLVGTTDPCPGAGLAHHLVAEGSRVREPRGDHIPARDLDATYAYLLRAVEAYLVQGRQHLDEIRPQAVLERHPIRLHPTWDQQNLLVLDVDALDRSDALWELEDLRL